MIGTSVMKELMEGRRILNRLTFTVKFERKEQQSISRGSIPALPCFNNGTIKVA